MAKRKNTPKTSKKKKAPKRSEAQRQRDLFVVADLYLQGFTQAKISKQICQGKKYTLTVATISKDIKEIEAMWLESTLIDFGQAKANELAKLDLAEAELWLAWHRSKEPKLISSKEANTRQTAAMGKKGKMIKGPALASGKTSERYEQRDPNPRYMDLILDIVDKRLRILGAFAPEAHLIASVDLAELDRSRAERWKANKDVMLEALQLAPAIMQDPAQVLDLKANGSKSNGSKKKGSK